ncbi:J domain-containing protein [Arthrobacter sp. V1I7]|uniref:J domain-containing protein n=1 Tax=Arthrobacter sp. V1I7 TaxID=3042274 RepID=UPI0027D77EB7|nr:J domain-containing protein [Arthrobacter sp. V1I7]
MKEHSPDPYEVLHLRPAATARDVTRAYRSLVRTHHPDTRAPETVDAGPESSAQELHDIMDAYAVLGDPVRRAAYDRQRRGSPPPEPAPSPPPHEPSRAGPPSRSGPALIIGPVRLENPGQQATGQPDSGRQITGRWDLFGRLPHRGAQGEEPAPGEYRILWWVRR